MAQRRKEVEPKKKVKVPVVKVRFEHPGGTGLCVHCKKYQALGICASCGDWLCWQNMGCMQTHSETVHRED